MITVVVLEILRAFHGTHTGKVLAVLCVPLGTWKDLEFSLRALKIAKMP